MVCLEFLGSHALRNPKGGMTSLRVSETVVIDAGNLMAPLGDEIDCIDHIFLTHSHLDHINDLPYLIDTTFDTRDKPLKVYATAPTLEHIRRHLFCSEIWADFTQIALPGSGEPAVVLETIEYGRPRTVGGVTLTPVPNNHIAGSCGYLIEQGGDALLFTSDTGYDPSLTELVNENETIRAVIFEMSFPDKKAEVAQVSGHMTPALLRRQLEGLRRDSLRLYLNHSKPAYARQIRKEIDDLTLPKGVKVAWIEDGDCLLYRTGERIRRNPAHPREEFYELLAIGTRLGSETQREELYREILRSARRFTHADAGTLYSLDREKGVLRFDIVQNETLGIDAVSGERKAVEWPAVALYDEKGRPNRRMAAAQAALSGEVVAVADLYRSERFDFSGAKAYDAMTGYRSVSMLVVPMKGHEGEVIGVLQLINRKGEEGEILPFSAEDKRIACSLASLAAVAMQNRLLIEGLEAMLVSFLESLAKTLEEKSPSTGRHIERVSDLVVMLTDAIDKEAEGRFAEIGFSGDEKRQIHLAALVHDIGKIAISDLLIEKATKLEQPFDRIELVALRMELIKAQCRIDALETMLRRENVPLEAFEERWREEARRMDGVIERLRGCNRGDRPLSDEDGKWIRTLAKRYTYRQGEATRPLLEPEEAEALSVRLGTLTEGERRIIQGHIAETLKSLERLKFPDKYRRIPEIAGAHHEKLDGSGYPRGLRGDEIPLEARILAVADIFEALTAADRPYKKPNRLSEAMRILFAMAEKGELDPDIVRLFYESGLYRRYAEKYLQPGQIDDVAPPA